MKKYTKSEALLEVARLFRSGVPPNYGICAEICKLLVKGKLQREDCDCIRDKIHVLLGEHILLTSWLCHVHGIIPSSNPKKLCETRAQWCEWLAKEFEGK